MANPRKFTEFRTIKDPEITYVGAEIWGGALWAIRDKLGREVTDSIVATAWLTVAWPDAESQRAIAFATALLAAAKAKGPTQLAATDFVLRTREFPLPGRR